MTELRSAQNLSPVQQLQYGLAGLYRLSDFRLALLEAKHPGTSPDQAQA